MAVQFDQEANASVTLLSHGFAKSPIRAAGVINSWQPIPLSMTPKCHETGRTTTQKDCNSVHRFAVSKWNYCRECRLSDRQAISLC